MVALTHVIVVMLYATTPVLSLSVISRYDLSPVVGFPLSSDDLFQQKANDQDISQRLAFTLFAALESSECLERFVCLLGVGEVVAGSYGGRLALFMATIFVDPASERLLEAVANVVDRHDLTRCEDIPCGQMS